MLNIFDRVNAKGQSPSRYAGEEMERLVATLQQPLCVEVNGDHLCLGTGSTPNQAMQRTARQAAP